MLLGVSLWGLHMGITQGLLATMVADTAPVDLRGTAYGLFNLASGLAMFVASVLAGLLWDGLGASVTFYAGAIFSGLAILRWSFVRQPFAPSAIADQLSRKIVVLFPFRTTSSHRPRIESGSDLRPADAPVSQFRRSYGPTTDRCTEQIPDESHSADETQTQDCSALNRS